VKVGKSITETLEMLREAFGEHSLGPTGVSDWYSRFEADRMSVEDDERSGRPSTCKATENVEKIREFIHEDRRRTFYDLADTAGISYGVRQELLTETLNMRRIAAKFVPRLLTNYQKQRRVNMCLGLRETQLLSLGS
jgi:hypothetical protein